MQFLLLQNKIQITSNFETCKIILHHFAFNLHKRISTLYKIFCREVKIKIIFSMRVFSWQSHYFFN